jgi:hypothetical protein
MRSTTLATAIFALVLLASPATLAQSGGSFGSSPNAPQTTPPQPPTKSDPVAPEPGAPAAAPSTPAPVAAPAQPANLPSAADIFKKSVDAIGGEAAVRKHSAMRVKGKLGVAGMQQGDMEILMLAPNKFLTAINMGTLITPYQQCTSRNLGPRRSSSRPVSTGAGARSSANQGQPQ